MKYYIKAIFPLLVPVFISFIIGLELRWRYNFDYMMAPVIFTAWITSIIAICKM